MHDRNKKIIIHKFSDNSFYFMFQLIIVVGLMPSSAFTSTLNKNDSEYPYIQYISFFAPYVPVYSAL